MNELPVIPVNKVSLARRKLVYGVGINDADYNISKKINGKVVLCPFYSKWKDMIKRCYNKKYLDKQPTYNECYVCDEWLSFSNFRKWMESKEWEGKQLDKDILIEGNKVYSPDSCVFIDAKINTLLNNKNKKNKYGKGVYLHRKSGMFAAELSESGVRRHLGYFDCAKKAEAKYIEEKSNFIRSNAVQFKEKDAKLYKALIRIADQFTVGESRE